ncbi:hypothetical protein [Cohnella hongkongensis]|uniref:Uncharacterized protein n=1 Tax=Cohnella hongkongensis TaxID=178337 RepID=A0ABV9FH99_9BACL
MKTAEFGWRFLDLASQVSEMKQDNYKQLLALSTLIELLVEKGLLTAEEIREKSSEMEAELNRQLLL